MVRNTEYLVHDGVGVVIARVGGHGKNTKWWVVVALVRVESQIIVVIKKVACTIPMGIL